MLTEICRTQKITCQIVEPDVTVSLSGGLPVLKKAFLKALLVGGLYIFSTAPIQAYTDPDNHLGGWCDPGSGTGERPQVIQIWELSKGGFAIALGSLPLKGDGRPDYRVTQEVTRIDQNSFVLSRDDGPLVLSMTASNDVVFDEDGPNTFFKLMNNDLLVIDTNGWRRAPPIRDATDEAACFSRR